MTDNLPISKKQIQAALDELDDLARAEYGDSESLESLLLSPEPVSKWRVQRLVGIVLKKKFAKQTLQTGYSVTGAQWSWPWDFGVSPKRDGGGEELALLEQLRMPGPWNQFPGPWNEVKPLAGTSAEAIPISWEKLKEGADS